MSSQKLQRVLVVDDEPDILAVIRITLQARGGLEVEVCGSGAEALAAARSFSPDLILLDVMMPGVDGPAVFEALRDDPETAKTPVVFMTAKTMKHEVKRYLELGAAAVIAKPFDQSSLADELTEIAQRVRSKDPGDSQPALEALDPGLTALLDSYAAALPSKVQEIRALWACVESGEDVEAARTLYLRVHALAGTAATYGHPSVSDVARQLEQAIGDGKESGAAVSGASFRVAPALIEALDVAARAGRT